MTAFPDPPAKLRDREIWLAWEYITRDDEPTKRPINAETGGPADATDPETWTDFKTALAYYDENDVAGIGFAFPDSDTLAGVDLDDVRDPETGDVREWARDVLDTLDSYTERSPSGTGYHVVVVGFKPGDRCRRTRDDGTEIEAYDDDRFFTYTGEHVEGRPATVEQRHDELGAVYNEYLVDADTENDDGAGFDPDDAPDLDLADEQVLDKARNAENGDKFSMLWDGREVAGLDANGGQNERDLALAGLLAFWTGGDRRQIDRLFRQSGLMRGKWDENRGDVTYGERTISKALDGRTEFYDPDAAENAGRNGVSTPETRGSDGQNHRADGGSALTPAAVMAAAGLDADDGDRLADLTDREKAYHVHRLIADHNGEHLLAAQPDGTLFHFDGGVWVPEGEQRLRVLGRRALGPAYSTKVHRELAEQVRADRPVSREDMGAPRGTVAVENGLLDLDAREVRDLRPDDHALTRLPVRFDPDADATEWREFVGEVVPERWQDAVQEYVGYCLCVGELPIHRAMMLVGEGANGKSTFLNTVRALLGEENTTCLPLQTLANERDAVADFHGSLANIDADLSAASLGGRGVGMFKKLLGGDTVRGRKLYQQGFEFEAVGKHLYSANEVPDVADDVEDSDDAFWRRWLIVEFPRYFRPHERDYELGDRLTEPESLSGVLNWALEGRARLLEQGRFSGESPHPQEKRSRWQSWGDVADEFVENHVERDETADRKTTGDVHRRFAAWCRANDETPVGQRALTDKLKSADVDYSSSVRIGGRVERGYKSLGFAPDVPDPDAPDHDEQQERFGR